MAKKKVPVRGEWVYQGADGRFTVWRAGKNDYRITDGEQGEQIASRRQFGEAHTEARRRHDIASVGGAA